MYNGAVDNFDTYKDAQDIGKAAKISSNNFSSLQNDPKVLLENDEIVELARVMTIACNKLKNALAALSVQVDDGRVAEKATYLRKVEETQAIIDAIANQATLVKEADMQMLWDDLRALAKMMVFNTSNVSGLLMVTESIATRFNSPDYLQIRGTLIRAGEYFDEVLGKFSSKYLGFPNVAQDYEEKTFLTLETQPILTPVKHGLGKIVRDGFVAGCKVFGNALAWPFVKLGDCVAKVSHAAPTHTSIITVRYIEQRRAKPDKPAITNETSRLAETATPGPTTPVLYSVEPIVTIKYSDHAKSVKDLADNERDQGRISR